jgi:hypothetical protein
MLNEKSLGEPELPVAPRWRRSWLLAEIRPTEIVAI